MRGLCRCLAATVVCVAATGCRHKQRVVQVPVGPAQTLPLERAKEPPLVAKVPMEPAPPVSARKLPKVKVKKARKKAVAVPAAAAPVEVASAPPAPAVNVIGALTAGGDAGPAKLQEAAGLVAALDKRIAGLPGDWKQKQKDGLVRVRSFADQARGAIRNGDGDGAVNLATKARLLLDDLLK